MSKGLHVLKNNSQHTVFDADNLFWAVTKGSPTATFVPRNVITLYDRMKSELDSEMKHFRFDKELTAIYIDPTDKCNANCSYCYVPETIRHAGRSMTKEELSFILDKLKCYFKGAKRKQVIIFHASEPLLVKDIVFGAIDKYKSTFKFGLQTNATLLEKQDVDFLKRNFVGVGISLDSHIASKNNKQRPMANSGGNFTQAVKALEWFDGYAGLNVISTVTKYNFRHLPSMVKFLHEKKVPCVLFNPVRFTRVSPEALKPDEKLFAKYFIQAVNDAINLTKHSGRKIIVGNFTNTVLAIIAPQARRLMCDISPCGGGRCFFTITAAGEMIPCGEFIGLKGFSGGNIFRDGISKAMESKPFKIIRARLVENIEECNVCELRNICGAPCPAELHAYGNMNQKAMFCEFYKEVIKYAFEIIAKDHVRFVLRDEPLRDLNYKYELKEGNHG